MVTIFVDKFAAIIKAVSRAIENVKGVLQGITDKAEEVSRKYRRYLARKYNDVQTSYRIHSIFSRQKTATVKDFVTHAGDKLSASIIPFKTSVNEFTDQAVAKILTLSQKIEAKTKEFEQSLNRVNGQIDTQLNPAVLQQQLKPILQQVDSILQGKTVKDALKQADEGITAISEQLGKISLEPVFEKVREKTRTLEGDIRDLR